MNFENLNDLFYTEKNELSYQELDVIQDSVEKVETRIKLKDAYLRNSREDIFKLASQYLETQGVKKILS